MRIERDRQGTGIERMRLRNNCGKNLAMPPVHPIEIADRGDGRTKSRRHFGKRTEDRSRMLSCRS